MSCAHSANHRFEQLWRMISQGTDDMVTNWRATFLHWSTLDEMSSMLPADYTMYVPRVGDCADWARCMGLTVGGMCACFAASQPRAIGRSFLSTDPERAAELYLALFPGSWRATQNISTSAECANVTVVRRPTGETFTFVQDGRKPNPLGKRLPLRDVFKNVAASLTEVEQKRSLWSQWEDNHDGYGLSARGLNITRVLELTGVHYYTPGKEITSSGWRDSFYGETTPIEDSSPAAAQTTSLVYQQLLKDTSLTGVFRFWIPGTLWTGEIGMRGPSSALVDGAMGKQLLAKHFSRNPDLCRVAKRDYVLNEGELAHQKPMTPDRSVRVCATERALLFALCQSTASTSLRTHGSKRQWPPPTLWLRKPSRFGTWAQRGLSRRTRTPSPTATTPSGL
jgi:hypothetical protein